MHKRKSRYLPTHYGPFVFSLYIFFFYFAIYTCIGIRNINILYYIPTLSPVRRGPVTYKIENTFDQCNKKKNIVKRLNILLHFIVHESAVQNNYLCGDSFNPQTLITIRAFISY